MQNFGGKTTCTNQKAWITSSLFSEWLLLLDKEISIKNKKIALQLGNCSVHDKMPALKNVELCFFSANCNSIVWPLDMGIIKNFKTKYHSCLVQHVTTNIERNVSNPYSFNVKQAVPGTVYRQIEDVDENVVVDEIMQDDIQSDLEIYSAVPDKAINASVVEYLSVDDEALVFEEYTNESINKELKGNSSVEDSDDDSDAISVNLPPLMELISQLETIQQVASSIPSVSAQQLIVLEEINNIHKRIFNKKETKENK
ncbi:tigger transposable element-derived protein 6-like [Schistocerca serialis cubense]|uniref:tigger transposable element-derived protein 6-like n=1 Tax=Schistocerca serialis cubense TaxID=2023355 RepID=UPI00214E7A7A|nr:tigger transposable element-derived protein 6-like [Schistocerca serialis cubense]XP_049954970.1 tigger transposable element-derived protein 6-like [Schistocerca serialis cubense]